ncbi:MAG: porphobilinogen synthase [Proteobacteria bacterium]|nr:porphobilinogen synthase [Pseudomonadota bacterium]
MVKASFPSLRMRRLRHSANLRSLVRETRLSLENIVLPLFIKDGANIKNPIQALAGHYQFSLDRLPEEISEIVNLNIPAVILFGIPERKDFKGLSALSPQGIIQKAVTLIKKQAPQILVITDLCFCEYTDHGHCGMIGSHEGGEVIVDNDATLALLAEQAVSHAKAGADVIAPSGMMDGMVQAIRHGLDQAGFVQIPILSYSVKYCSAFYGPFREAAGSGAPQFGGRQTYQMDPANSGMGLREAELDVLEGADMLMVKPAHTYLDMIARVKQCFPHIPLGAYHVSGEYAMIKAAAAQGWLDEEKAMWEALIAIKRAGADFIITYYAKRLAQILQRNDPS